MKSPLVFSFACALCLGFAGPLSLHAQSADQPAGESEEPSSTRLAGGGPLAARALANQINDPTAPLTLVQFRDVLAPSVPGFSSPANLLQVEPVFPIFPSHLLPFEQLMKMTLPFPTTPNPGSETGMGDFQIFDLVSIKQSWGRWGHRANTGFPDGHRHGAGAGQVAGGPGRGGHLRRH